MRRGPARQGAAQSREPAVPAHGVNVPPRRAAVGEGRHSGLSGQTDQVEAARVIGVDDRERSFLGAGGQAIGEQPRLAGKVRLHVAVIVQVVPGQVGEHRAVEIEPVRPVQVQRVGGDLHGDEPHARGRHVGQKLFDVDGLGCGERRRPLPPAIALADGADDPARVAGRGEDGVEQVRDRGLAVGAGHPHQHQGAARMPEERRSRVGHRPPRVRHPHAGGFRRRRNGSFHHHRGRPPLQSIVDVVVAVRELSREREEGVAVPDLAGVAGETLDGAVQEPPSVADVPRLQQLPKQHRHQSFNVNTRRPPGPSVRWLTT